MLSRMIQLGFIQAIVLCNPVHSSDLYEYVKCQVCETKKMDGQVSDCSCEFETVDSAVDNFFIPLLQNLTSRTFFRYFRIDLDRPCPFWDDEGGMCTNEACAICPCEEGEIPREWLQEQQKEIGTGGEGNSHDDEYGWISRAGSQHSRDGGQASSATLGKVASDEGVTHEQHEMSREDSNAQKWEDRWEWTEMTEDGHYSSSSVYVNLVKNPEKFTGYSGPSARLVWKAVQEENCFGGGDDDECLEKRIFHRLISGLQSSISTQIAREYYWPPAEGDFSGEGRWGPNIPMFIRAVGAHPSRVANLYFAFLFVSRAVAKAGDLLVDYDYSIGDAAERRVVEELVQHLVRVPEIGVGGLLMDQNTVDAAMHCRKGFDESSLFQAQREAASESKFWEARNPSDLREEFRNRFRNISRIMDCVTCEKCKTWGKLEMLGLGTAIKILLTPEEELTQAPMKTFLTRQEVVALINTFNQLAKSIHFASKASELELREKITQVQNSVIGYTAFPLCAVGMLMLYSFLKTRKTGGDAGKKSD